MAALRTFSMAMVVVSGLFGGFGLGTGEAVQAETLTVGAAPSLKAALHQILPMFESEYGAKVTLVYGPSQTLRRQIEKGAPIDVFLPAAIEEVEKLHQKGLTLKGGVRIYAQTSLVLVMSAASLATSVSFREVLPNGGTRIALGDPKTSSLGDITARALTKLDPAYKHRSHLLYAQHAEEIVNLLHTAEADVGIVYRVDAINSGHVRIIDEAPAGTHTPVQFGGAIVWTSRNASLPVAEAFLDFMTSPRIQKLLIQYGFDPVPLNGGTG
jgi:molybdate transport system substrate-binding protein